jgi:hypothetical protein
MQGRGGLADNGDMTRAASLTVVTDVHADLPEVIGELCWLASAAHAVGDRRRRDEVLDLASELAAERRMLGLVGAH